MNKILLVVAAVFWGGCDGTANGADAGFATAGGSTAGGVAAGGSAGGGSATAGGATAGGSTAGGAAAGGSPAGGSTAGGAAAGGAAAGGSTAGGAAAGGATAGGATAGGATAGGATAGGSVNFGDGGTPLEVLARSMPANSFAELSTTGMNAALAMVSGSTGNVLPYSDDLVWNPRTQEAFFIGADHLASQGPQFVSYSARTNTWQRLPRPAWLSGLTFFHGYDHTALDPVNQRLFHRPFGANRIHRYDIAAQTWSELPQAPLVNTYANCCDALEHFPALGGLIWVRGVGEIWLFSDATQQWRQVATFTVPNGGTTWTIAEHSAATQTVVLGAGGLLYRLNAMGQVTPLVQPPQYYDGSGFNGVLTTDPVSGDFLLLSPTARVLRVRDAATDTWTQISAPGQPSLSNRPVIATPIAELGVTVFASCAGSACRMHLFKR